MAPAMDGYMFENPATQENVFKLGWARVDGDSGRGRGGWHRGWWVRGRLADVEDIIGGVKQALGRGRETWWVSQWW